MKLAYAVTLAASALLLVEVATAKVFIIVLPPDAAVHGPALQKHIAEAAVALPPSDQLFVYTARPVAQLAAIARPADSAMNKARINAAMATQFKPVKDYLGTLPNAVAGDLPGNLMIPQLIDELGRNLIPSLPDKRADILLMGSMLHHDRRDGKSSMLERYVPSDGVLHAPRTEWVFSIVGAQDRLTGSVIHYCSPNAEAEYESSQHASRVQRFWALWTMGQGGRVGTFSSDVATCFRRFTAAEASGQTSYQLSRDPKPEMVRIPANVPATLPANYDMPGPWFLLRDDVVISKTPPASSKGFMWVGIRWDASCDLDLYARGEASSPWLYFGSGRTAEGYFNKDFLSGTGEAQYEFVEFSREVDLSKAEVAVNLYSCNAATAPEGNARIWFSGKVFESPFKLGAKNGNKGAMPIAGPNWVRIDLRKVVGLSKE
jgi:hypothetical protein